MRPITLSKVLTANNATAIVSKAALAAAGFLPLNGSSTSANLIVNGTFATTANWTLASPWSIAAGVLTFNGTNVGSPVAQGALSATLISGHSYTLTYDVTVSAALTNMSLANMGPSNGDVALSVSAGTGQSATFTYGRTTPDNQIYIKANGTSANSSLDNLILVDNTASTPVTLDTQRRVLFTDAGNDSARTATIVGTNDYGGLISESVTLTSGSTVATLYDYKTINQISINGAIASTISVGTNTTGSTPWIMPNYNLDPFAVNVATQVSGSVTFQGETTLDDYFTAPNNVGLVNLSPVLNVATPIIASGSSANVTALTSPFRGFRLTVTTGTGTVTAQFLQAGIIN
jgi:hypothetical protein